MHKLRRKGRYFYLRERSGGVDTEIATGKTDKKAAVAWARQHERDLADPEGARRREAERYTLQQAVEAEHGRHETERDAGRMREATVGFYEGKMGVLLSVFGVDRTLATIDAPAVDGYIAQRRKDGVTAHTIHKELGALRLVLKGARRAGRWFGDVERVMPMNFSPDYQPDARSLTVDEVRRVMAKLPPHRAAWLAMAAGSGAEKAALQRAERGDLDEASKLVRVRGTKTEMRERTVPLVLPVCAELVAYAFDHPSGKGRRLFSPWTNAWTGIQRAARRAKVEPFSLHSLRHSFTLWHLAAGVSFDDLAKALGHSGTAMLHRVYGRRLAPEALRDRIAHAVASKARGEDAGKRRVKEGLATTKKPARQAHSRKTQPRTSDPRVGGSNPSGRAQILGNSHKTASAPRAPFAPFAPCSGEDTGKFLGKAELPQDLALDLLRAVDEGAPAGDRARSLAVAVLAIAAPHSSLWARALAVVEGGPLRMRHAVELAGQVLDATSAEVTRSA